MTSLAEVAPFVNSKFCPNDGRHFKLQPHGPRAGPSSAYMKAKPHCMAMGNHSEFYLHHLLCWMYHGPPPSPNHVAGHLCHHKRCLLPWHLAWMLQSENVQMGWDQRKRKWPSPD